MKNLKTGLLFLFIFLGTQNLNAQVQNTSWEGVFNVPSPQEGVFEFKTDTVYVKLFGDILETSRFKTSGDTLTLQKLSGGSPCDTDIIGIYRFKINDDKLLLTMINDDCAERAMALPEGPMTAVEK